MSQKYNFKSSNLSIFFKRFECPYHGWTYSTSGRLTKATRLKGIQDFAAKNFGLIPIEVDTWGPFIYINLRKTSTTELSSRRKLHHDFEHVGQQIENFEQGLRFVKRVIYDMNCNWKVSAYSIAVVDLNQILNFRESCTQNTHELLLTCVLR